MLLYYDDDDDDGDKIGKAVVVVANFASKG